MPADPDDERTKVDAETDDDTDDEPGDDSFLMGHSGVQAEVEADLARAEAELAGEAPPEDDDDAIV
jgi:hypothetical protein